MRCRDIQEQITNYSFSPPDKRFTDTGFFLPDFNEKESTVKDILFMVDTSGSVSNEDLGNVYAEIAAACEQFHGKLQGKLGFFDTSVTEPIAFESVQDVEAIIPYGNGGTDFRVIFQYIKQHYDEIYPSCIVIFTDGYGPYPVQADTLDIPVMWIITTERQNPPFGKVIRFQK